ncbi:MAG: hypothetical protein AB8B74_08730 [Crocinitomicaceae bacterium]
MSRLKTKFQLFFLLLFVTNFIFSQGPPPPPPGPPVPFNVTNNTVEDVEIMAFEILQCNSGSPVSTTYVINPGQTIQFYHTIPSNGTSSPSWLGLVIYWFPTLPVTPTLLDNPYSTCSLFNTILVNGQPQAFWMNANTVVIY